MEKQIIKEELGISNDVKQLVSLIKSSIGDNFSKNSKDKTRYRGLTNTFPYKVFHGDINAKWKNININIKYYVMSDADNNIVRYYLKNFSSTSNIGKYELVFYLVGNDSKIKWEDFNRTVQHEVEHLFQLYKKGKQLLTKKQNDQYQTMMPLMRSRDRIEKIIGTTYYYYNKVEKNALINGIYGDIMGRNIKGSLLNPLEEIQNTFVYHNINAIKQFIENEGNYNTIIRVLKPFNKTIDSYLRIANTVVREYTKAFGRLLYILKKDIAEENKDLLINYDNINLEDNV